MGFLTCAAWYALVIAAFLALLARQSDVPADNCSSPECFTDRFGWFMFGMFVGAPMVFVAFVVSLVVLGLLATRYRIRSAVLLGTVAATPALLMLCVISILTAAQ